MPQPPGQEGRGPADPAGEEPEAEDEQVGDRLPVEEPYRDAQADEAEEYEAVADRPLPPGEDLGHGVRLPPRVNRYPC